MLFSSLPFLTIAQGEVDDLQIQKDEKRRQLLEIKNKITALQSTITNQRNKIASLNNEIELYDLQISQTEQQIEAINTEVEFINLEVVDTLKQIGTAETDIKTKRELLTDLIREIYVFDQASPLEVLLSGSDFSHFLNVVQDTLSFQETNQELLDGLNSLKEELVKKNLALDEQRAELQKLKLQVEETQSGLVLQLEQKEFLLNVTRGQESRYQNLLVEVSGEEAKIQREIFDLDLSIRQQLGDKTVPSVTEGLATPMDGILTQGYGNTGFTSLGYSFHNGIDIAAPPGTPVRAAGDGVVYAVGTGETAYGNWVVIRHTVQTKDNGMRNIFTLYAHLSKIHVNSGVGVLQGDIIGSEGNTGNTTRLLYGPERGYHLHFTIFDEEGFGIKEGAYQDIYGAYQIPYGYTYNPFDFFE